LAELSRRPYLLRAMLDWIIDSGYTPHLIVDATFQGVRVPRAHVKEGRIVLNISASAVQVFQMDATAVSFQARFGGVAQSIYAPMDAVLGIYARETGQGMVFQEEVAAPPQSASAPERVPQSPVASSPTPSSNPPPDEPPPAGGAAKPGGRSGRPALKVVK
jgi:stringent starvation protein B